MGKVSFENVLEHIPEVDADQTPYSVYNYQEGPDNHSWAGALPKKQGLYDPELEKDACGVGFAAYVDSLLEIKPALC